MKKEITALDTVILLQQLQNRADLTQYKEDFKKVARAIYINFGPDAILLKYDNQDDMILKYIGGELNVNEDK